MALGPLSRVAAHALGVFRLPGEVLMPTAPLHACAEPQCGALLPAGVSRCPAHARPAWVHRTETKRIRGDTLQRLRRQLFAKSPLCVMCLAVGRYTIAVIRDHVIPLAEGGLDREDNVQALCRTCSDVKTFQESRQGRLRRRGTD